METRTDSETLLTTSTPSEVLEGGFRDFAESILQHIDQVFFWRDPSVLKPYFVSAAYERIWGWPCDSVYREPSSWIESIHPDDRSRVTQQFLSSGASGQSQLEYRIIRPDGEQRWVWVRTFPLQDAGGNVRRLIGTAQDHTEQKLSENTRAFLASIVESSDDSIVGSDMEGTIRSWNHGAERLFGYTRDEAIGQSVAMLFQPEQRPDHLVNMLNRVGRFDEVKRFEAVRMAKGGIPVDVSVILSPIRDHTGEILGLSGIYRDIRDRRRAEHERELIEVQLRHSQKLESVGRLAAGVAHEINTPIQFVSDSLHFVRDATRDIVDLIEKDRTILQAAADGTSVMDLATDTNRAEEEMDLPYILDQMPVALERAMEGLNRVAVIVRSMKEFAHPDQKQMTKVDLNQAIETTLMIARNEYKYVADVETDLADIPHVTCHAGDINQAILNLIVNAADAVRDAVADRNARGRITIRTRSDGESVIISISDTGTGIPAAIRDQVFDLFFTTKEVGKGTGQGLAIARSVIVGKHGGQLTFESETGQGTTFEIRLPVDRTGLARAPE